MVTTRNQSRIERFGPPPPRSPTPVERRRKEREDRRMFKAREQMLNTVYFYIVSSKKQNKEPEEHPCWPYMREYFKMCPKEALMRDANAVDVNGLMDDANLAKAETPYWATDKWTVEERQKWRITNTYLHYGINALFWPPHGTY